MAIKWLCLCVSSCDCMFLGWWAMWSIMTYRSTCFMFLYWQKVPATMDVFDSKISDVVRGKHRTRTVSDDCPPLCSSTSVSTSSPLTAVQQSQPSAALVLFMVTLCNRADHYIFALWFLSSIFFFFSSPNLSGRRLDVYHTSAHGVALVWI